MFSAFRSKQVYVWNAALRALAYAGVFILVFTLYAAATYAEERELKDQRPAIDAVLLIDASGSMMLTDPLRLRYEGAKLLLQFLGKDDRLAIVSFSGNAQVLRPLEAYGADQTAAVTQIIEGIKTDGRFTDLYEAVKAGRSVLEKNPRDSAQRVMILMSDGKMEPDPAVGFPMERTQDLVTNYLPDLKAKEIKIYTLAFSEQADKALLGELASASDGLSWYTAKPDDIHKSFADLFLAVKRPQVVPLTSRGFQIDEDVQEATFYITHEEGVDLTLLTPDKDPITETTKPESINWFKGKNFDVITMQDPKSGDWEVQGVTSGEGFATVLTNLRLASEWPTLVRADEPVTVQARLYEAEKPVALPEMSGVIKYGFQVSPTDKISEPIIKDFLVDDGTSGDNVARDGIFSRSIKIKDPGEYKLTIVARGPTFQRTQQVPFRVKPQLVALRVVTEEEKESRGREEDSKDEEAEAKDHDSDSEEHGESSEQEGEQEEPGKDDGKPANQAVRGDARAIFRVELSSEVSALRELRVKLSAKTADRKKYELPLKRSLEDPLVYEYPASGLPKDGRYILQAELTAETKKREAVDAASRPVIFERVKRGEEPATTVKVIEEKEEAAPPPPTDPFPFVPLILITLGNTAIAFAGKILIKRVQSGGVPKVEQYQVPETIAAAIATLEKLASTREVDLKDPMFAEDGDATGPEIPAMEAVTDEASTSPEEDPQAQIDLTTAPINSDDESGGGE